ncbi:MAG TPA: hypothetical protein VEI97_09840 [bacterium]|nr:hypothetical protein [bacterium]
MEIVRKALDVLYRAIHGGCVWKTGVFFLEAEQAWKDAVGAKVFMVERRFRANDHNLMRSRGYCVEAASLREVERFFPEPDWLVTQVSIMPLSEAVTDWADRLAKASQDQIEKLRAPDSEGPAR